MLLDEPTRGIDVGSKEEIYRLMDQLAGRGVEVVLFAPPHTRTPSEMPLQGPRVFTPEWVADDLVRTLRRGRACHLAGASNRVLLLLRRIAPAFASRIMRDIGLRAGARALARA